MSNSIDAKKLISKETITKDQYILYLKLSYIILIGFELFILIFGALPVTLQTLVTSISCIIIGSFQSLKHPDSDEAKDVEIMKRKDAYKFPVTGSMVLFGAYIIIKKVPKYIVNMILQIFFVVISAFGVETMIEDVLTLFIPKIKSKMDIKLCTLIITWKPLFQMEGYIDLAFPIPMITFNDVKKPNTKDKNKDYVTVSTLSIIALILGFITSYMWYQNEHWLLGNIIGLSFSIQAITLLNPGSYVTAVILLTLLFFYDIFWVFGTDVMVTVAKELKAPIKLTFPRGTDKKPSMLGLGDIVLPGIYMALLLRYDITQFFKNITIKQNNNTYPKCNINTFYLVIISYILSLGLCLFIMFQFEHAQPALLYLVPGTIIPIALFAFIRGDFNTLYNYDETPNDETTKDTKKQD